MLTTITAPPSNMAQPGARVASSAAAASHAHANARVAITSRASRDTVRLATAAASATKITRSADTLNRPGQDVNGLPHQPGRPLDREPSRGASAATRHEVAPASESVVGSADGRPAGLYRGVPTSSQRSRGLTESECLGNSVRTATTGRRAVGRPPQSGFRWRRGFALSVFNVTGHLPTPRHWGTGV
jgi:hypothetical protein